MNKLIVIGLDLTKNVFEIHGINEDGDIVVHKQLNRREVLRNFARLASEVFHIADS
jgi:transposase